MPRNRPIIFIDDDIEDLELLKETIYEMRFPNEVITFDNAEKALSFLMQSDITPLFIVSDINMPKMNGLQLRVKMMDSGSAINNAPFMFLSTTITEEHKSHSEQLRVHGYYKKSNTASGLRDTLMRISSLLNIYIPPA